MSNDWQTLLDETPLQFVELSNGEKLAYRDFRPDAPRGPLLALPGNASDHRSSFVHLAAHKGECFVKLPFRRTQR